MRHLKVRAMDIVRKYTILCPTSWAAQPQRAQIEPTNRCNLKCIQCARNYFSTNTKVGDMSFQNFKRTLLALPYLRSLTISGYGEPLLNNDLTKMIKFAKSRGIEDVSTFSNFTLMTKPVAYEIVHSGLDWINFSIDSIKRYESFRGGSIKKTLRGLSNLIDAKKESNSCKPSIYMNCTVTNENKDEVGDIVKLASEYTIDCLNFKTVVTFGFSNENLRVTYREMLKEIQKAKELSEKFNVKTNLDDFLISLKLIEGKQGWQNKGMPCYVPWLGCFISWYGAIRPCCSFFDNFIEFGNVFEEGFREIWNNKKYRKFRKYIINGVAPHKICLACNAYAGNLGYHKKVLSIRKMVPFIKVRQGLE